MPLDAPSATWQVVPPSRAVQWNDDQVPRFVISDFAEACLTETVSPKASATLSRRCLQSILRDFYQVAPRNLAQEIAAVRDRVSDDLWITFEALREIGNVGAHPERDPAIIVEVEAEEATEMIDLLEIVIHETYIDRANRKRAAQKAASIVESRRKAKQVTAGAAPPQNATPGS